VKHSIFKHVLYPRVQQCHSRDLRISSCDVTVESFIASAPALFLSISEVIQKVIDYFLITEKTGA